MAASVNVITAVLTLTLSACLARTSDDPEIMPPYQLAFVNQSALFTINSKYDGYWQRLYEGTPGNLTGCACVKIEPNKDNKTPKQFQLHFNPTTVDAAGRYGFYFIGGFDQTPTATLSLLDVAVKTNISDRELAAWDYVTVTCTLLFYYGYDKLQPAFSALINITTNDREPKPVGFNSTTTSSGNVSFDVILPASEQYHCTASFLDNNAAVLKTKTVSADRHKLWSGMVTVETTPAPFNSAIAVGLGVGLGLGLPIVILVVIVVCVVCVCRRQASKTRYDTKPENRNDVSEHTDDNDYSMGDSKSPGQRTSTHLTVVDNNVYASAAYVELQPPSPSAVALRPQPEGSNNAQVYDEIRMSVLNSKMTETNGHVSKATSSPPVLPQDGDHLTVPETDVSLSDSQTDLTLVDSAIYGSAGTGMQLQDGEAGTATTTVRDTDGNITGEAAEA